MVIINTQWPAVMKAIIGSQIAGVTTLVSPDTKFIVDSIDPVKIIGFNDGDNEKKWKILTLAEEGRPYEFPEGCHCFRVDFFLLCRTLNDGCAGGIVTCSFQVLEAIRWLDASAMILLPNGPTIPCTHLV